MARKDKIVNLKKDAAPKIDGSNSMLSKISSPEDIKHFNLGQLEQLAKELRLELINITSKTGGHLGASLGVVELTIALHYVFNSPKDKIIWDVGHQSYPHKMLTGRYDKMHTIRQGGGLAGFTKIKESPHDSFGAGHSSTSISAGLGMAVARDLSGQNFEVIPVIGDGALSAGMAYEALNNAGALRKRLIVVLNDNDMSIAPPVGAISKYLNGLISSKPFLNLRSKAKDVTKILPQPLGMAARKAENLAREITRGGNIFEQMGFYYIGPVDGHNLDELSSIFKNIRDDKNDRPYLIHVATKKGKGYAPAESAGDKFHGVGKFDIATGKQLKTVSKAPSYTGVFAKELIALAEKDQEILAVTAAMPSGTGVDKFSEAFPDRSFDVGIAEQHAVTFAAGLAAEGKKPYVCIYSTFLQRGYDQLVHDVAVQNLPVRFIIDRAGLVGADGPTHAGSFDITYLCTLPNLVVMAPSNEAELAAMVYLSASINNCPSAIRFPRGNGVGVDIPNTPLKIEIGKGKIVQKGSKIALLVLGTRLEEAKLAAQEIKKQHGFDITIADARFAKPIDTSLVKKLATEHDMLVTLEEGAIGGFATQVTEYLKQVDLLDKIRVKSLFFPDEFLDQDTPENMYKKAGLDSVSIVNTINKGI